MIELRKVFPLCRAARGRRRLRRAAPLLLLWVAACSYQPPRFADRPPVWVVADDRPIPLPRLRRMPKQFYYSDVYVRRALVKGLDPNRIPEARDVNSLDEVPRSSWYRGVADTGQPLAGYRRDGPPVAPFRWPSIRTETALPDAMVIIDARGLRYELEGDLQDRPEMRTAAAAIASRLLWSLGYWTPEVWVTRGPYGERVAATRWTDGVDLGPTPMAWTRADDPNDLVPHVDRRSLRGLGMVAAWLDLERLTRDMIRDEYVGLGGRGHVRHQLVGWSGALGVDGLVAVQEEAADPDRQSSNFFFRLVTLGLSPKPPPPAAQARWPSLGQLDELVAPDDYKPSPPFGPRDRLTEADAFWLAKRLADVSDGAIDGAIAAGHLSSSEARERLGVILRKRRKQVVDYGFSMTTPCDLARAKRARAGGYELVLLDRAIAFGSASPFVSRYELTLLDAEGEPVAEPVAAPAVGPQVVLPLPTDRWASGEYRIANVVSLRRDERAPRGLEAHLLRAGTELRVVGLRH
ncbi:MAG: hypothetical protein JRI23_31370 [Deltaproteobacteria bacterium]|jgi:hypothetical protein|nr:hypothetical protein [Deltaproteobacteria bacterium]MBW2536710.1 hypothetical protein [Deltaproteobacteria bacterium]